MIITWTMSLIILLIIYIPIIYVIVKKGKKAVVKIIFILLALISMPIAYVVIIYNFPYYYLAPFEGKAIDSDTRAPIAGAAVLVIYYKEVPSVAGSNSYAIDAQETLTDNNGEFKIPEYKKWFGEKNGAPDCKITIFKPGYGVFPRHELSNAIGESKTWPPPEKYIVYEIPKLKTREERDRNLIYLRKYNEIPPEKRTNYYNFINQERIELGYTPYTTPN